jgi:hypothetical protein
MHPYDLTVMMFRPAVEIRARKTGLVGRKVCESDVDLI